MNLQQITSILSENKEFIHRRYKAEVRGIFGSYSRGEQKAESDLDVLVAFDKGATLFTLSGLSNFLQEKLGIKVDVVSERAIKKNLRPYIENDLVKV
jgi:predicted nucleotidyltransferase